MSYIFDFLIFDFFYENEMDERYTDLSYFYGLLFKNKGCGCGELSRNHWLNVINKEMMYFAELHSSQWLSCRLLTDTPVPNI